MYLPPFASEGRGNDQARLLRMIWGQLGPALKPLIPFGNLSIPGIDLKPTRVDRRQDGWLSVDHEKRGDVSIKLPYNSPENYVRRPR